MKRVAFGLSDGWDEVVRDAIDPTLFSFACVDFRELDLTQFDFIVALTIYEPAILRRRYGEGGRRYLLPNDTVIALCADKKIFNTTVADGSFGWLIPRMYGRADRVFPYVLKMRNTLSGIETFVVRDPADEAQHVYRLRDDRYFCQEYVPGRVEYATHMLMVGGNAVYHQTHLYEMADEFLVKGSALPPIDEIFGVAMDGSVIETLVTLLRSIGFEGACCVNYKLIDGQVRLLEVNPRVGFSLFRDINRFLTAYDRALQRT